MTRVSLSVPGYSATHASLYFVAAVPSSALHGAAGKVRH
jgi:hypothetical protein